MIVSPMRLVLLAAFLMMSLSVNAQCQADSLRMTLRDARKQMKKEDYEAHLLKLHDNPTKDKCNKAVVTELLATFYLNSGEVDKSIKYREETSIYYADAGDALRANFCIQNIGFLYEERKHDIVNARKYIEKALKNWQKMKDTTQQANLNKYMGYLEGKAGNYISGKKYVKKAIAQFTSVGNDNGIAVCYFDMGTIFFEQGKYDSTIAYLNKAYEHWMKAENGDRMFGINNFLLRIYLQKDDTLKVAQLCNSNELLLSDKIYWEDKLKFYHFAMHNAHFANDKAQEEQYTMKYNSLKDSLTKAGIKVN